MLKTGPHGYLRSLTDGKNTLEKQEGDPGRRTFAGPLRPSDACERQRKPTICPWQQRQLADEYIYQSTFNDQFLTAVLKELVPTGEISLDIMAASAFRPSLTVGSQTMASPFSSPCRF